LGSARRKNVSERHSFGYFSLAVERKVTRRQGGRPTKKVKPSATSESLQTNQISYVVFKSWKNKRETNFRQKNTRSKAGIFIILI